MCWTDFVSFMEGGPQGGPDSPPPTESQDAPLLQESSIPSPPVVALNDRALLITPSKPEPRLDPVDRREKLDRLSALSCLDRETPLPRKRHPMTIMRTMSERSLDRGRVGLLNLLSERVHAERSTPVKTLSKSPVGGGNSIKMGGGLTGVERALEIARENVRASLNKTETKRREAVWDLFQSECAFLYDHLMVLKNVSTEPRLLSINLALLPSDRCSRQTLKVL
nr:uncharacterized protein LOC123751323 [Procambarus clarkii]